MKNKGAFYLITGAALLYVLLRVLSGETDREALVEQDREGNLPSEHAHARIETDEIVYDRSGTVTVSMEALGDIVPQDLYWQAAGIDDWETTGIEAAEMRELPQTLSAGVTETIEVSLPDYEAQVVRLVFAFEHGTLKETHKTAVSLYVE
ncbi:hypothetical protein [Alkalicoccus luteus]|uniref:hypothetical protein n=1 Tax=Alkalicoccus luteus TaxID=1237094 RepID=UPI0040347920